MDNITYGFVLTIFAGLSTMLGTIFIFTKKKTDKIIIGSLSFAAGVMITVSLTDLIPESYHLLRNIFPSFPTILYILIFMVSGIILSMLIDKYLPDNRVEESNNHKGLYRVGLISMLAIILHNLPEGMATFMATHNDVSLGISLAIAIALHNIPEGISISIPIYYATNSRLKACFYTLISGLSEPLGALLTYLFLSPFINDRILGFLFSLIAGIMCHIAIYELLPTAKKYENKRWMWIWFIIGVGFMIINHFLF